MHKADQAESLVADRLRPGQVAIHTIYTNEQRGGPDGNLVRRQKGHGYSSFCHTRSPGLTSLVTGRAASLLYKRLLHARYEPEKRPPTCSYS